LVVHAVLQLEAARDNLRKMLETADDKAPDFPETLAYVRDHHVVTMRELAEWCGLRRQKLYDLLAEHDEGKR